MLSSDHQLLSIEDIEKFTFGHRRDAEFTIVSKTTGSRFTYRVRHITAADDRDLFFFDVLRGAENEHDYSFVGTVWMDDEKDRRVFKHSRKSKIHEGSTSSIVIKWFINRVNAHQGPEDSDDERQHWEFWYSGHCSVCGRKLTVPESLERGMGPKCAERAAQNLLPKLF